MPILYICRIAAPDMPQVEERPPLPPLPFRHVYAMPKAPYDDITRCYAAVYAADAMLLLARCAMRDGAQNDGARAQMLRVTQCIRAHASA